MATEVKHEEIDEEHSMEVTPKYSIGQKVRKYFEGSGWFTGRVESYNGKLYNVVYDDGDSEECDAQEMEKILLPPELEQIQIGSRVAVYRPEDDQYYEATVARERIDQKPLYLEYDNGASEWLDLRKRNFLILEERARRRIRLRNNDGTLTETGKSSKRSTGKQSPDRSGDRNVSKDGELASSEITVGSRVAVYRPTPDRYYEATVTQERGGENPLYLEYVCGDREWTDLRHRDFLILEKPMDNEDDPRDVHETNEEYAPDRGSAPKGTHLTTKQESAAKVNVEDGAKDFTAMEGQSKVVPTEIKSATTPARTANKSTASRGLSRAKALSPLPLGEFKPKEIEANPDLAKVKVGSHIAVYMPDKDQYCEAVVTRKRYIKKPLFVEYANGSREWIDLRHRKFVFLEETIRRRGRRSHVEGREPSKPHPNAFVEDTSTKSPSCERKPRGSDSSEKRKKSVVKKRKEGKSDNRLSGTVSGSDDVSSNKKRKKGSSSSKQAPVSKVAAGNKKGKKNTTGAVSHGNDNKTKGKNHKTSPRKKGPASELVDMRFDVGTKVAKFFRGHGWFHGEVTSFNGWHYLVTYSDGDTEEYDEKELSTIVVRSDLDQVGVGSRVAVHWPGDDKFYEATVIQEDRSRRKPYYVEYDTGHFEWLDLRKASFCLLGGGMDTRRRMNTSTLVEDDSDSDSDISVEASGLSDRMETVDDSSSGSEFWKS